MSNDYLQFSVRFKEPTEEEIKWWKPVEIDGVDITADKTSIDLIAEESGNVDNAANQIQMFLKKFRPNRAYILLWSTTCSVPAPDAFCGGAVAITADRQEWFLPGRLAAEYLGERGYNAATLTKE